MLNRSHMCLCILFLGIFLGWTGISFAALQFDLDFDGDSVYENTVSLEVGATVSADIYVSNVPSPGLRGMGFMLGYDASKLEVTQVDVDSANWIESEVTLPGSGPVAITALYKAFQAGGIYGDHIRLARVRLNVAAGGSSELRLYDHPNDWFVLADEENTVLDSEIPESGVLLGYIADQSADLKISKTADAAPVSMGDFIRYSISVVNDGPDSAAMVVLSDALAAGLTQPEYSSDSGQTWLPWSGEIALGDMEKDAVYGIQIRAVTGPAALSGVGNTAAVTGATVDPNPVNNTSPEVFVEVVLNITGVPGTTVQEDDFYTFTPQVGVAADDTTGGDLVFSIQNKPLWAEFDTATGELSGTPENSDVGLTQGILISVSDPTSQQSASLPAFDLTVKNVNDPPTIAGTPDQRVSEDTLYYFRPIADDEDLGDFQSFVFSIQNQPPWSDFNPSTGELSGMPENGDVGVNEGIVITVTDPGQLSASLPAFDLTVENVNDIPEISGYPARSVKQNSLYHFTPVVVDPDVGDTLAFSIQNPPGWSDFKVSTGELSGIPENDDVGVAKGIVISVKDGSGAGTSLPPFNITVQNVNDPPRISGVPMKTVLEDSFYRFTPAADDPDPGETKTLIFDVVNLPVWAEFDSTTGTISGTPENEDVGVTEGIVLSVSDVNQATVLMAPFDLTVVNVNDPPRIYGTPATRVKVDETYSFTPEAADDDAGDFSTLVFSIENLPTWAEFDSVSGELSGTPASSDQGTLTEGIRISVTDNSGASASLPPFDIRVQDINDPPTLSGNPSTTVLEDAFYSFTPVAKDPDIGEKLTFSIENRPSWALFNTATGMLSGTPSNEDVGTTADIIITVTDASQARASLAPFDLTVINVNDPPTLSGTPATRVKVAETYSFTPEAADPDIGDAVTLVFSIENLPSWAVFDSASGKLFGTPESSDQGTVTEEIVITVTDSSGASASLPPFNVTVNDVNDPPTIAGSPPETVLEDENYVFTPTAEDPDVDETLVFSIENPPSWADFNPETGTLSGTPGNEDVGTTADIIITVTDASQARASLPPFDLTVVNVNDPPTISGAPPTTTMQNQAYEFVPFAEDPDSGDILTFSIQNQPVWLDFESDTGRLSGIPRTSDVGLTEPIVITVTDNSGAGASLEGFRIEVLRFVLPGDVDDSGSVDLQDALLTAKILADMVSEQKPVALADVNSDHKIGTAEMNFILQTLAEIR